MLTDFPRSQGQEKPLLIFTFENFKIGRYVTASVVDPLLEQLEYTEVGEAGNHRQNYSRYRANLESDSWIIPGQRPVG